MPDLLVDIDAEEFRGFIRAVYSDQLDFVTATAVNWTALDAQRAQRARQERIFDVTRPEWVERSVKLWPFAKKRDGGTPEGIRARVRIDPPGGQRRRDVIAKFEDENTKTPFRSRFLWVPINAPDRGRVARWRPKALKLRKQRSSKNSRVGKQGGRARQAIILKSHADSVAQRRTFAIIRPRGETSMIFEREPGDELNLLWVSKPSVDISDTDLRFAETITAEVRKAWSVNFTRSFDRGIQTARSPRFTSRSTLPSLAFGGLTAGARGGLGVGSGLGGGGGGLSFGAFGA